MLTLTEVLNDLFVTDMDNTLLLGIEHETEVPVFYALDNVDTGALVVYCERNPYRNLITKAALYSGMWSMRPRKLRYYIIADDLDAYYRMRLERSRHLTGLVNQKDARDILRALYYGLSKRVEADAVGNPFILLVLDEVRCLSTHEFQMLEVLMRTGPRYGIHTLGVYSDASDLPWKTTIREVGDGIFESVEYGTPFLMEAVLS